LATVVGNTGRPGRGLSKPPQGQPPQQPVARHQPVRCYEFRRRNEKPLFVGEPPSDARAPFVLFCAGRSSGGTSLAGNKEGERGLFGCVAASLDWGFACGTEQHRSQSKAQEISKEGGPDTLSYSCGGVCSSMCVGIIVGDASRSDTETVSYTHLRAHET